jgi:hypothetical protein
MLQLLLRCSFPGLLLLLSTLLLLERLLFRLLIILKLQLLLSVDVDFGTPSYKFTVNICMYLIF